MPCNHMSGDFVSGTWVCGQCWKKLPERPYQLTLAECGSTLEQDGPQKFRQVQVNAPIAIDKETGNTLGAFIRMMAAQLVFATGGKMHLSDALDMAIEICRMLGEKFGCADYSWDKYGARELIHEEMQYWDGDGSASGNGGE